MIERYSTKEMEEIWDDFTKLECWIRIEMAALHALQEEGTIPKDISIPTIQIRTRQHQPEENRLTIPGTGAMLARRLYLPTFREQWLEEEEKTHHDVVAFIHTLEPELGEAGRFLHYGMTSSDLCDTEFAMRLHMAMCCIKGAFLKLQNVLRTRADEFRHSPIIGRTHGMHAEPTTFGLVLLSYVAELKRHLHRLDELSPRIFVGKLSGAVGTYAHISPKIEAAVMKKLNLGYEEVSSQVVNRDRHAELFNFIAMVGATVERLAIEIRHLSRSEVKEVAEPFGKNQKGSSAMPHKKNPIKSENVTGMARLLRHYAGAAMENIALWHQRDISHSSVERVIAPDATGLLYFMLQRMTDVVKGLIVDEEKMKSRVVESSEMWMSQTIMLNCITKGMSRTDAHTFVQNMSNEDKDEMRSRFGRLQDWPEDVIKYHLRNVTNIFARIR